MSQYYSHIPLYLDFRMPNSFSANVLYRQNRTLKLCSPVVASMGIPFEQEARFLADFGTYLEGMLIVFNVSSPRDRNLTLSMWKPRASLRAIFFKTFNVGARASGEKGGEVLQMDFDMLATKASAQAGSCIGVDAGAHIFICRVSYFDASLGVGVATGVCIRDAPLRLKLRVVGLRSASVLEFRFLDPTSR
ncbi:hypothetical protein C8R45DRAFT_943018 [Mycena sanguinolenta]|nr:hypothetical protein C8R45DRAFT_943018 [Mycena sanguinolenta]